MEVPYNVQLTQDKLPEEIHRLLDNVVGDTTKIAVLLMMEQHMGHESGWAPYVRSLPCKAQMHNMMFWNLNELHMVRNSSICDEAIEQKTQVRKEFSAVKPALERFPHFVWRNQVGGFHACFCIGFISSLADFERCITDFLNHDGVSDSISIRRAEKCLRVLPVDAVSVGNDARARHRGAPISSNPADEKLLISPD